ncbi:unnamed protein product [Adineta steineri]|nr:unnamed protein product [Adineta steineri]
MANKSDVTNINSECFEYEERLMQEREKQQVKTPPTYDVSLSDNDIRKNDMSNTQNNNDDDTSSFKLLVSLINDWWKSSNSSEKHLKSIYRKVVNMLSKCVWTIKVIRIIFRLMSNNLKYVDQQQGDRSTGNLASIDVSFQHAMENSIQKFLLTECQRIDASKYIIWSNTNDVSVGFHWYQRKMLIVETLLTLQPLKEVVNDRLGKRLLEKNQQDCKLDKAKVKVLNFPVVFFTRSYLTNNRQGAGSGQFTHSYDVRPDELLSALIDDGLLIGGNFIKNRRISNENLQHASFCKQLPSIIKNNHRITQAFERLGLDMSRYETTFEHQYLPLCNEFTNEAIQLMKTNDEFVQYYHNYYKGDSRFQSFCDMVNERVRLGQIKTDKDNLYSNDCTILDNQQNECIQNSNIIELNNIPSNIIENTANAVSTDYHVEIHNDITSQPMTVQAVIEEASVNHTPLNVDDTAGNEHHLITLPNSMKNITDLNKEVSTSHNISNSPDDNITFEPSMKNSFEHCSSSPFSSKTIASSITIGAASTSVSNKNQIIANGEQFDDDEQFNSNMVIDESYQNEDINNSIATNEQSSNYESMSSRKNVLNNPTNIMSTSPSNSNDQGTPKRKGRGRPSSTNVTSNKWSIEKVDDLLINPKSYSIWKSIILKRQFIVGTATDLFKMIPARLFDEKSRFKIIDFLILKKILIKGDWFRDAKGDLINGFLKGSPTDPQVAINLVDFGIDIQEYKFSLNSNQNTKRHIDGKMINQSYLFSDVLQIRINSDEWFKENIEINEKLIYSTNELSQTTSNYQVDKFQQQQKEKVQRTLIKKRKKVEELQEETTNICGKDMPAKRKRKPKIRDD